VALINEIEVGVDGSEVDLYRVKVALINNLQTFRM
jgi:hypothetical protein